MHDTSQKRDLALPIIRGTIERQIAGVGDGSGAGFSAAKIVTAIEAAFELSPGELLLASAYLKELSKEAVIREVTTGTRAASMWEF